MNCTELKVTIGDLVYGYEDTTRNRPGGSVLALNGLLDVRPAYQRQFVYDAAKRENVIRSILEVGGGEGKGPALGVMHWQDVGDGRYEVVDGQQRIISIAQFVKCEWSVDGRMFDGFSPELKAEFLSHVLHVCLYSGSKEERVEVFKRINVAGETQSHQEVRNHA